jgi:hypothetical protein
MYEELIVLDADDDSPAITSSTVDVMAENKDKEPTTRSVTKLPVPTIQTNHRESAFQMDDELQEWKALTKRSLPRP